MFKKDNTSVTFARFSLNENKIKFIAMSFEEML